MNKYTTILLVLFSIFNADAALSVEKSDSQDESVSQDKNKSYAYIISIDTTNGHVSKTALRKYRFLSGYYVYEVLAKNDIKNVIHKKNTHEIILKVGFFSTEKSALNFVQKISSRIEDDVKMTVSTIPVNETKYLNAWLRTKQSIRISKREFYDKKELELLMERARLAMVQSDYRVAIANYTKIIGYEDSDFSQAALEYLGLARERNQQYAHAKAEYSRYIKLYPDSDGAERVKQRLAGMLSASMQPKLKLKKGKSRLLNSGWRSFGGLSQYYRRDVDLDDDSGDDVIASRAYSSFYYSAKFKNQRYELKNRISVSHNMNLEDSSRDKPVRVSSLYSEIYNKRLKTSGRFGRQRQNASGAFGRFDGAVLSYHHNSKITSRLTSGYPVDFNSFDRVQTDKRFYSFNMEVESLFNYFDVSSYFINQFEQEILNRSAIGFEFRHFDQKKSLFSTMDYDVSYQMLNNFVGNFRYQLLPRTSVGILANYRRSPFITTLNALQGQGVTSVEELLATKTEEEIRDLAEDRTAQYAAVTSTLTQKFSRKVQLSNDYTISKLSSTVSSDGVTGTEGTGFEHYISTQLIATDSFLKNDVTIIGVRFSDMDTSERVTLNLLRQDPLPRKVRLSTRFRADYQRRDNTSTILNLRPSLKVNYKHNRTYKFEFEAGLERSIRRHSLDAGQSNNGFFGLGYFSQF